MFYINYEECKYLNTDMVVEGEECFILTMRNVNRYIFSLFCSILASFILTMRNVNLKHH